MPAGDAKADFDAMLRAKAEQARHDPGEPGPGDPLVSRTLYALRDLHAEGPAMAEDVLEIVNAHLWLSPEQRAAVLARMRPQPQLRPVGPKYEPPGQRAQDD